MTGINNRRIFLKFEMFDYGIIVLRGQIWQVFFWWLHLGILGGIQNNLKIRGSARVSRPPSWEIKYNQTSFTAVLIFNALHCIFS